MARHLTPVRNHTRVVPFAPAEQAISGTMTSALGSPTVAYAHWLAGAAASLNTITQRVQFLRARLAEWGTLHKPAHEIGAWLNQYSGWTRYTYYHHLRSIYEWMIETGQTQVDPLARFHRPRAPRPNASPLEDHELADVLANTVGDLHTWIMLGFLAGLRTHEIAKVHGRDVTADRIRVLGKGGHEAWVPTHPDLWSVAQQYPRDDYWFPSPQARREYVSTSWVGNSIRDAFRDNSIAHGAGHRLRHTYATHLMRNGVPMPILQQMMRHASLETTQAYIGINAAELAAAVRTLDVHSLTPAPLVIEHRCACPCGRVLAA